MYSNYDYHYVIIKEPVFSSSDCSTCFYLRHVSLSEPQLLNDGALEIIVNPSLKISVVLSVYNIIFCIINVLRMITILKICVQRVDFGFWKITLNLCEMGQERHSSFYSDDLCSTEALTPSSLLPGPVDNQHQSTILLDFQGIFVIIWKRILCSVSHLVPQLWYCDVYETQFKEPRWKKTHKMKKKPANADSVSSPAKWSVPSNYFQLQLCFFL